jgi:hypothetical protein
MPPITFGSRVTACDCLLTGRVSMVWVLPDGRIYYRVQFPPRSPFLGDWTVYRQNEIALLIERPRLTNLNIVNLMRPKTPTPEP